MTAKIYEDNIEMMALQLLQDQGYRYQPGLSVVEERPSLEDVLLLPRLEKAVTRLNPAIPPAARADAIRQIQRLNASDLIANNEAFHRLLTEGITVAYPRDLTILQELSNLVAVLKQTETGRTNCRRTLYSRYGRLTTSPPIEPSPQADQKTRIFWQP